MFVRPGLNSHSLGPGRADHLGSTVGVMDASGTVVAKQAYWPYGATRAGTTIAQTDRLFTGQRQCGSTARPWGRSVIVGLRPA